MVNACMGPFSIRRGDGEGGEMGDTGAVSQDVDWAGVRAAGGVRNSDAAHKWRGLIILTMSEAK